MYWGGLRGCSAADVSVATFHGALLPVRYSGERTLATKAWRPLLFSMQAFPTQQRGAGCSLGILPAKGSGASSHGAHLASQRPCTHRVNRMTGTARRAGHVTRCTQNCSAASLKGTCQNCQQDSMPCQRFEDGALDTCTLPSQTSRRLIRAHRESMLSLGCNFGLQLLPPPKFCLLQCCSVK